MTHTPTATPTLTPSPTPGATDLEIAPSCGPLGSNPIIVEGVDWPKADVLIEHLFAGDVVQEKMVPKGDINVNFTVPITIETTLEGEHTIQGSYWSNSDGQYVLGDAEAFTVPCPPPTPTPTPTPLPPNLIVESFALENEGEIAPNDPVSYAVTIANDGETDVSALFWVDLFINPSGPINLANPPIEISADWAAINGLAAQTSTVVSLDLPDGVDATGVYTAYVMVDTLLQVVESKEEDNLGGPVTFTAVGEGPPPAAMSAALSAEVSGGAIGGSTWLQLNGEVAPQGRAEVYCYSGDRLVAETTSDREGRYRLPDLPPGTYTVVAELFIDGIPYTDVAADIVVKRGETTPFVTLYLN
jgi:hypothetical protein